MLLKDVVFCTILFYSFFGVWSVVGFSFLFALDILLIYESLVNCRVYKLKQKGGNQRQRVLRLHTTGFADVVC